MSYDTTSRQYDAIDRGNKGIDYAGKATFVVGRMLDPFVQYAFLKNDLGNSLIKTLRGSSLPQGPPLITNTSFDKLGLSPYRTILFLMSCGSMVKQNYHQTAIMQEKVTVAASLGICAFNTFMNSVNSLLFVCAQTSASTNGEHFPQTPLILGSTMYVLGMGMEWISEQQRHNWKKDPANKGRVYEGGLFRLSRHINYLGYTLWRSGYALAAGGWTWGIANLGFYTWFFVRLTIPVHQHYMEEKYGEKFEHYKKLTPYRFMPGVY